MGAVGGGGAAVAAALFVFVIGCSLALFLRGSFIAYRVSRSVPALGMLVGHAVWGVGLFLFWNGGRQRYDEHGRGLDEHGKQILLSAEQQHYGFWLVMVGFLVAGFCFVSYVKQHEKLLQTNAASPRT